MVPVRYRTWGINYSTRGGKGGKKGGGEERKGEEREGEKRGGGGGGEEMEGNLNIVIVSEGTGLSTLLVGASHLAGGRNHQGEPCSFMQAVESCPKQLSSVQLDVFGRTI